MWRKWNPDRNKTASCQTTTRLRMRDPITPKTTFPMILMKTQPTNHTMVYDSDVIRAQRSHMLSDLLQNFRVKMKSLSSLTLIKWLVVRRDAAVEWQEPSAVAGVCQSGGLCNSSWSGALWGTRVHGGPRFCQVNIIK